MMNNFSPQALAQANDDNFIEFHRQLACLPDSQFHHDLHLTWFTTPIPMGGFNGVLRANLEPDEVEPTLERVTETFRERGVRWNWAVGPATYPSDLGERLLGLGMKLFGGEVSMAADLHALREDVQKPHGLQIVRVRDEQGLAGFMHAMIEGFGPPEDFNRAWEEVFTCLGLSDDLPMRHYVGLLDGEPVASSSLFLGAGVAGVYFVATVPQARRQGVGSAMVLTPLLDARAEGYRVGILQASEMGSDVYRRLGFEGHGSLRFYVPE